MDAKGRGLFGKGVFVIAGGENPSIRILEEHIVHAEIDKAQGLAALVQDSQQQTVLQGEFAPCVFAQKRDKVIAGEKPVFRDIGAQAFQQQVAQMRVIGQGKEGELIIYLFNGDAGGFFRSMVLQDKVVSVLVLIVKCHPSPFFLQSEY